MRCRPPCCGAFLTRQGEYACAESLEKGKTGDIVTPVAGFRQVEVVTLGEVKRSPVEDRPDQGWGVTLEDL